MTDSLVRVRNNTPVPDGRAPQTPRPRPTRAGLGDRLRAGRRGTEAVFRWCTTGAGIAVLAVIVAIGVFLLAEAVPALRANQANFLTYRDWFPNDLTAPKFGIAALAAGTVLTAVVALAIAVPVALGIGLFLSHYAPRRLASALGFVIDLLAAVPSVIFGLWGRDYLVGPVAGLSGWLHQHLGWLPLFGGGPYGNSVLLGSLVLAIMVLPIVTALSRDVFVQTPKASEEAALALGATRWEMVRTAVLPAARPGIVAAVLLGLGRALGETIALAMTLGATFGLSANILHVGGNSIAANIANGFAEANPTGRGALIASGLVLFAITLVVNMTARALWGTGRCAGLIRRLDCAASGLVCRAHGVRRRLASRRMSLGSLSSPRGEPTPHSTSPPAMPGLASTLRARRLPAWAMPAVAVGALACCVGVLRGIGSGGWVATVVAAAVVFAVATWAVARFVEGGRAARDRLATIAMYSAFLLALLPLGAVLSTLVGKGVGRLDGTFFWHSMNNITSTDAGGGAYHAIVGTLEQVGIACVLSIPIGLAAAVYLVEYGRGRLVAAVRFFVDVMTGIPSIVAGLFVLAFWVLVVTPMFNDGRPTYSGLAASMALTVLMVPTIVRSAEEMLRIVPAALREGSYALGVPKWKTILRVVLPTALPGIVTGVMLAVARAAGETAPVILVAGGTPAINFNPLSGNQESLSYFVYDQAGAASRYAPGRAWTAALTLIVLVAVLTIAAKLLARRSTIGR